MTGGRAGQPDGIVDLRRLPVAPGGAVYVDVPVPLDEVTLGGQIYAPDPRAAEARLAVSASASGTGLRLQFVTDLHGPCQRCVSAAVVHVDVDIRDFQTSGRETLDDADAGLDCEYLSGPKRQVLDVAAWARDAVAEAVPMSILCRDDCRGICPTCGSDLNATECACVEESSDPRWAALGDLAERLRAQSDGAK